jgi:hypothetical protein
VRPVVIAPGTVSSPSNPPTPAATARRFPDQLAEVSRTAKVLSVAVVAVQGALLSFLLVPEQLGHLSAAAPALCALGLLMSWVMHRRLDRVLGKVVAGAALLLVALLVLNQLFVKTVTYEQGDRSYIVGYALNDARVEAARGSLPGGLDITRMTPEQIIGDLGPLAIADLWSGYSLICVAYVLVFSVFAFAGALAFGGAANRSLGDRAP